MAEAAIAAIASGVGAAGAAVGGAFGAALVTYSGGIASGLFWAAAAGVGEHQRKSASRRATAAYNASLQDRMVMVDLQPDAPATLVLGRVRTVEGVRRRFTTGTHDEKLTLIVSFAGHEIDAFEQFYFNDQAVTLDGSGWVLEEPYNKSPRQSHSATVAVDEFGAATYDTGAAIVAGSAAAVIPGGAAPGDILATATIVGTTIQVTGAVGGGASVVVTWQTASAQSFARVRTYRGQAGQNVGAALAAEYPGKLTADDAFAGMALAVVDLTYDQDAFPQGIPNITAVIRGAKVLDARTATIAWSENPALLAYHYARHANGWAVPADEIRTADIDAAATLCEQPTVFTLRTSPTETTTVTLPLYRCGLVINTAGDPGAAMAQILETMAGRDGWAGGTWRLRAGTSPAPVAAMDPSWLVLPLDDSGQMVDGAVLRLSNGVPRENKVNRVEGRCVDADQRYQVLPFPGVSDAVLIAAEGEYQADVELSGVSHIAHAQHLARIRVRQSQAALRMQASCGYHGWRLELFDVVASTLPRYEFVDKPFEVVGWRWHPTAGATLSLEETSADIYSLAELDGRDPAPNGGDPPAWLVEQLAITSITSGTPALTDTGSIITRTLIQWGAAVAESVRVGGSIELQYIEQTAALPTGDWPSWSEQGSATSATIPGLRTGVVYLFRVRAISAIGVRGRWSVQVAHKVADAPTVAGFELLILKSTGYVFVFEDEASAVSDSPSIQFEAVLIGLAGPASWAATAYDITGASLGAVTLIGAGNFRELTAANFVALGVDVQTVVVAASFGAFTETATITRFDRGSTGIRTRLTNENHILPADAAGVVSSYAGCGGTFEVWQGATLLTNLTTPSVSFGIAPGGNPDGLTGTVDADTGVYAVTGMPDAVDGTTIVLRATLSTGQTFDEAFGVVKSKAGGAGVVHYFSPLTEIVVPVNNAGDAIDFSAAHTNYIIARGPAEEQATWTLTPTYTNCVGTLVGNLISITALASLGGVLSSSSASVTPLPSTWASINCAVWCDGSWALIGLGAGGTGGVTSFATSNDFATFTPRNVGLASGRWNHGAYGNGNVIAVEQGNSTRAAISTDKGVTWAVIPNLSGAQNNWQRVHFGNKFIMTGSTTSEGAASTTGAAGTWASLTMPAVDCRLTWYGGNNWLAVSPAGNAYLSTTGGSTWGSAQNATNFGGNPVATGAYFRGVLLVARSNAATSIYTHNGTNWGTVTTPAYRGCQQLYIVSGVLYLIDLDYKIIYTADGITWKAGSTLPVTAATPFGVVIGHQGAQINYLPTIEVVPNLAVRHLLGATSDSAGSVSIQASKAGETTVTKVLPVRKGSPPGADLYVFAASPGSLQLPSTADGAVTDYTRTITPIVYKNGLVDTPNWAISATSSDAGMVISVAVGGVVTVTSMANALDTANVIFRLAKAGQAELVQPVGVVKTKGVEQSGFQPGTGYSAISADSTEIAIKFVGDGRFQIRRGPAGSYQTAAYWALPVSASYAASSWIWIEQIGGDAVSSGLTAGFVAMTTDREVILTRGATGTYEAQLRVTFATSAAGANAVVGGGSLRLIVP